MRLAVVGDIHGQWSSADAAALHTLGADGVLFVGDIGNEDVGLVQQIASLDAFDKAVILGNHCAWYSLTAASRQRRSSRHNSPSRHSSAGAAAQGASSGRDGSPGPQPAPAAAGADQQGGAARPDRVQQQLDLLGASHIGYAAKHIPGRQVSIVGARPFSKGGASFSSIKEFMSRFGVDSMQASADKILDVIHTQVPASSSLVVLAHNGPAGLGEARHAICGVDWLPGAGDHGDPDLAAALQQLAAAGRHVALVVHGHMHHTLKGGGRRQMAAVASSGTVVLNAATVPRVVPLPHGKGHPAARHHFLVVDLVGGRPACAADVWVHAQQAQPGAAAAAAAAAASSNDARGSPPSRLDEQQQQQQQQQHAGFCAAAAAAAAPHPRASSSSSGTVKGRAAAAAEQQALADALRLQQPQQVQLLREVRVVDGWEVWVAEAYEVLRDLRQQGGNPVEPAGWEFFDAHQGRWRQAAPAAQAGPAAAAQGGA